MKNFVKPFAVPDDLSAVMADCRARLTRGVNDRRSPFHTPVVATAGQALRQRVMVLRAFDAAAFTLRFHTDLRSAKVAQLSAQPNISVLGYDAGAKVQISLTGRAELLTLETLENLWRISSPSARRTYQVVEAPGTPMDHPPAAPSVDADVQSDNGKNNFTAFHVHVQMVEWLELSAAGNRRACFTRLITGDWHSTWLAP